MFLKFHEVQDLIMGSHLFCDFIRFFKFINFFHPWHDYFLVGDRDESTQMLQSCGPDCDECNKSLQCSRPNRDETDKT
jgi:hypothetical protein